MGVSLSFPSLVSFPFLLSLQIEMATVALQTLASNQTCSPQDSTPNSSEKGFVWLRCSDLVQLALVREMVLPCGAGTTSVPALWSQCGKENSQIAVTFSKDSV